jgi:CheY-like chemotaxis protein
VGCPNSVPFAAERSAAPDRGSPSRCGHARGKPRKPDSTVQPRSKLLRLRQPLSVFLIDKSQKSNDAFIFAFCKNGPVSQTSKLPPGRILVIDDNEVIRSTLSHALSSGGYEVFTAGDGPEAFNQARRLRPDLILLDIFFPPDTSQSGNSWDAFMIIDWFQHMGVIGDTPIIVISGAEPEKFRDRCLASGVAAFFSKPIDICGLLDAIRRILGDSVSRAAPGRPQLWNAEHRPGGELRQRA